MYKEDAHVLHAHELCVAHIIQRLLPRHLHAHDAGKGGDEDDAQGEDDVILAAVENRDQHQRQQETGKGGDAVVKAHEDLVHPAAVEAGEPADHKADREPQTHGAQGDQEGRARPLHDAGEDVPPEVVRAEEVAQTGGGHLLRGVHGVGVAGRPE